MANAQNKERNTVVVKAIKTNRQLRDVSFAFKSLFKSGHLSAAQILREVATANAEYRDQMRYAAKQILDKGLSFADAVEPIFPDDVMPAIRAGVDAGNLDRVFHQIWVTAKAQEELNKILREMITPIVLFTIGLLVSFVFLVGLVPYVYESMASSAPPDYEPIVIVSMGVAMQKWLLSNWLTFLAIIALLFIGGSIALSNPNNRQAMSDLWVRTILKTKGVGTAYSQLRFGLTARYLEIVTMAGLDLQRSLKLVSKTLPEPLRVSLQLFERDVVTKGIKEASRAEGRPETDLRSNPVYWPTYFRLALNQADHTGNVAEAMSEYGEIMMEDGKEQLSLYLKVLNRFALIMVGLIITIPVGALTSVMGEMLTMRIQNM